MPQLVSAPFFSATPVFDRAEYASAVGRRPDDQVVSAMLTQHLRSGNIKRLARGVFASVPKHADPSKWAVDSFLAASRLRRGGIIAYHSALELHGYAYSVGHRVQLISPGTPGIFRAAGFSCRFLRPPRGFNLESSRPEDGIKVVNRTGLGVRVTTVEQTIVDLFDRPELAGEPEELCNSIDLVWRVDARAIVRHARARGNARAAGALGFWLERDKDRFRVKSEVLDELRELAPKQTRYALGAKPGKGRMARGWNVILPTEIIEPRFEGL